MGILRYVHKVILFGMVERISVLVSPQIPIVPHLRYIYGLILQGSFFSDKVSPIRRPFRIAARFVVYTVQDMTIIERMLQQFLDKPLLILKHCLVVILFGRSIKEGLLIRSGVSRVSSS